MNRSEPVTLEEIQVADTLVHYNIDNIILLIEETNDMFSIKPIIKFLRFLRAKLPSRTLSGKYWDLDEDNIFYYNQKAFDIVRDGVIINIPVDAMLRSEVSEKGGYGVLLKKAHDSTDRFIQMLKELDTDFERLAKKEVFPNQNELFTKQIKILEILFDIICQYFLINVSKKEFCDLDSLKNIELEFSKQSIFKEDLKKYQIGLFLKKIASYHKPLEERLNYNRNEKDGITPYNYYELKRALTQYLSNYKSNPISKKYNQFNKLIKQIFQELDTISKN